MGFTPLEGLMMGASLGLRRPRPAGASALPRRLDVGGLDAGLNEQVRPARRVGCRRATCGRCSRRRTTATSARDLAVEMFVHRLAATVGSMAAVLGGWTRSSSPAASASTAPGFERRSHPAWLISAIELDTDANARAEDRR